MLNIKINNVNLTCKPENLTKYKDLFDKPKKIKGTRQSAEKRYYPNSEAELSSTSSYVRAYLRLNHLAGLPKPELAQDHWILNPLPTTWPEGEELIITEDA
jgi:hypothetical protein